MPPAADRRDFVARDPSAIPAVRRRRTSPAEQSLTILVLGRTLSNALPAFTLRRVSAPCSRRPRGCERSTSGARTERTTTRSALPRRRPESKHGAKRRNRNTQSRHESARRRLDSAPRAVIDRAGGDTPSCCRKTIDKIPIMRRLTVCRTIGSVSHGHVRSPALRVTGGE